MNLFVGNLSPDTSDTTLIKMFSEFGEVLTAKIVKDSITGDSRGFGFVEMADKFHSFDAIDNLDCTYLDGNIISVKEAKPKSSERGGASSSAPRRNRTFVPRGSAPRRDSFRGDSPRSDAPPRGNRFNKEF